LKLVLGLFMGQVLLDGNVSGAGVTVVTHGFNGNATDWVIPMANRILWAPELATNASHYRVSITRSGGVYQFSQAFLGGVQPGASPGGEIIISLDWSTLAAVGGANTAIMGQQLADVLLSTNLIPALNGRPLSELPLHLAGHSRGASLMAETARVLGGQGIWVDHQTTMDPYPVGLLGDPAMQNYANVLFADNFWQNIDFPQGSLVNGAYNRQLTNLDGGYDSGQAHSDTHLWYHGTIDPATPTGDISASVSSGERAAWWTAPENAGASTGFKYSVLRQGDRFSTVEPAGPGTGKINDGVNRFWDLGLGVSANRTALPANNGQWPNPLRLVAAQSSAHPGQSLPATLYWQFGLNSSATATLRILIDPDQNAWNSNSIVLLEQPLFGTGTGTVGRTNLQCLVDAGVPVGAYFLAASLAANGRTRYLYGAPIAISAPDLPLTLVSPRIDQSLFKFELIGSSGKTAVTETSSNFLNWLPIATNNLANGAASVSLSSTAAPTAFFRAVYR
jgi:hypothetical protein